MKLPFDLGIKFLFRLLLPGFILTLGIWPALSALVDRVGFQLGRDWILAISTMILGWAVVALDLPIYMLIEGRAFWPSRLLCTRLAKHRNRVQALEERANREYTNFQETKNLAALRRHRESSALLRRYPLTKEGRFEAQFPTLLGNLIASFETYPDVRYGADGVFYWPRLVVAVDKDLREDLDTRQALADSTVYVAVCSVISGCLWAFYAALGTIYDVGPSFRPQFASIILSPQIRLPSWPMSWCLAMSFLAAAALAYRGALHTNTQFGEVFKATFDVHLPEVGRKFVEQSEALKHVARVTADPGLMALPMSDQYKILWRYLHNYRIKCPRCKNSESAGRFGEHSCAGRPEEG